MYKPDDRVTIAEGDEPKTVLTVDDDESIRLLIRNILEPEYLVFDAIDTASALTLVETSDFDVILIDHHLGGRDGLDLLIELRQDRKVDSVIIFMTSDSSRDLTAQAFRENADDFIGKPINRRLFKYAINEAIQKKETDRLLLQIQAKAKIEESKNLLIAMASHELHTPLIPLIGLSTALLKLNEENKLDKETLSDGLNRIVSAARSLNELIGEILQAVAMDKGDQAILEENTDLHSFFESLERQFHGSAVEKGLDLLVSMPDGHYTMFVDGKRLRQVLCMLVDNAVKFTEFGEIEIGFKEEGEHIVFFVRDTGPGIHSEFRGRLFEAFEKTDMKSGLLPGLGMGLYLCRRIVESMLHGSIELGSTSGRGSTFTVRLPNSLLE